MLGRIKKKERSKGLLLFKVKVIFAIMIILGNLSAIMAQTSPYEGKFEAYGLVSYGSYPYLGLYTNGGYNNENGWQLMVSPDGNLLSFRSIKNGQSEDRIEINSNGLIIKNNYPMISLLTNGLAGHEDGWRLGVSPGDDSLRFRYVNNGLAIDCGVIDKNGFFQAIRFGCYSDARLKRDILPYQGALQQIIRLSGITYFWKAEQFKNWAFGKEKQIGFIAQEVENVIPELVSRDSRGYKLVSYDKLAVLLVEALKELKNESDSRIDTLEKENEQLKEKIELLESVNSRIARIEKTLGIKDDLNVGMLTKNSSKK